MSTTTIEDVAAETLAWAADFREGMFHVHCHACGAGEPYLPPEFFGLLESAERLAAAVVKPDAHEPYALRCPVCEGLDYPGLSHNPDAPYCSAAVVKPEESK